MMQSTINEGRVYYICKQSSITNEILKLNEELSKKNINVSIIHSHYKMDLSNFKIAPLNEFNLSFYLFEELLWVFYKNGERENSVMKEVEEILNKSLDYVPITSKNIVYEIFKSKYSDNLLEMNIDGDNIDEFEESALIGSNVNISDTYYRVFEYKDIFITHLKFQPVNFDIVVSLRNFNKVEFNRTINVEEILKFIFAFNKVILGSLNKIISLNKGD